MNEGGGSSQPCPTCGRIGSCVECCCASPDHRRRWPHRPYVCTLCGHATTELTPEAFAAQSAINRTLSNLDEHP